MTFTIKSNTDTQKWDVFYNDSPFESFIWYVDAKNCVAEQEAEEDDEDYLNIYELYPIEVQVVGYGWCRFIDKDDMKKQLKKCTNDCWKLKVDTNVKDDEGNECPTDDEFDWDEYYSKVWGDEFDGKDDDYWSD